MTKAKQTNIARKMKSEELNVASFDECIQSSYVTAILSIITATQIKIHVSATQIKIYATQIKIHISATQIKIHATKIKIHATQIKMHVSATASLDR